VVFGLIGNKTPSARALNDDNTWESDHGRHLTQDNGQSDGRDRRIDVPVSRSMTRRQGNVKNTKLLPLRRLPLRSRLQAFAPTG